MNHIEEVLIEYDKQVLELTNRIYKAIDILEKRINKIENQEWKSYTGQTDEEYLQEQKELLKMLKGEEE